MRGDAIGQAEELGQPVPLGVPIRLDGRPGLGSREGAIAPVPRMSAEFERSGLGTCPEFLSRGLCTGIRRRFFPWPGAVSPNGLLSGRAASRARVTSRAPGDYALGPPALALRTLAPRSR